jgi:hypothetical protein
LQLSRRTDHVETRSPPYVGPYCSCVLEVYPCADEDERRSRDIYNAVWPHDRVEVAEVHSFKTSLRGHADLLAPAGGTVVGVRLLRGPLA